MTTITPARPASQPAGAARFGQLLLAEWTKLRSVRSTVWSVIVFVVVTVGFTSLITGLIAANWSQASPSDRVATVADPVATILGTGLYFGQLVICALGVLTISAEYSTGTIRASLLAVPRRLPMLAAKGVVFALLRHTAAGISTAIGVVFVLPIIAGLLPGSWGQHIYNYLPSVAGAMLGQAQQGADQVLTPWQGFAVLCGWTALLLAAAFYLLRRRDA
jgi:ABC-2 type transport system permease protein